MLNIINGDLMKSKSDIIGHQVNCKGVMGSGVAKQIKENFYSAYLDYLTICDGNRIHSSSTDELLGTCQIAKCKNKFIANLFGQDSYGRGSVKTKEDQLFKALRTLHSYAKENNLSVSLPWKLGCDRGGGNWDKVLSFITELFNDEVMLTIYRLT